MEQAVARASNYSRELEEIEIRLLLDAVYRYYGFDFRDYAISSLRRRIWEHAQTESLTTISALQERLLHDSKSMERFLHGLSVSVSYMFRDPSFFRAFRDKVAPLLREHVFVHIWVAGCSTGEEVYSLAILLEEEELYPRCRIYATDMNETVLRDARAGIFPLDLMKEYTSNYLEAGGKGAFSNYYTANYGSAIFRSSLRRNVVFAQHNLATDSSFQECRVVLCRNVLIYFNPALQTRVERLLDDSLAPRGVLCLGKGESLRLPGYVELDSEEKIFQRER